MLAAQDIEVSSHRVITAARGITLKRGDTAVVALLGAQGAGKTSILRALTGSRRFPGARLEQSSLLCENEQLAALDAPQMIQRRIAQVWESRATPPSHQFLDPAVPASGSPAFQSKFHQPCQVGVSCLVILARL